MADERVSTHWFGCYRSHIDCANIEIERWRKVAAQLADALQDFHSADVDGRTDAAVAAYDALQHIDGGGSAAKTMDSLPTSGTATDDVAMSETCIEVGTSLRAEDEPCLDPERCRRLAYCLRDPSDERYPGTIEP